MAERHGKGYFKRGMNNQWVTLGRLMLGRHSQRLLAATPIRPVYSSILVTHNCNFKCVMCSFWHRHTENELTIDEIDRVTGELRQLGVAQINFTGGEAFLRSDLAEIVRRTKDHGFVMIQVTTNGSLSTKERLAELFEAGLGRVALSVDGAGSNHETQRGVPGAWKKIIGTLDALRELRDERFPHIEIEMPMVLSRITARDLGEVLRLCDEYRAVLHLQFLDNVQFFTSEVDFADHDLDPAEVDGIIDEVHRHIEDAPGIDPLLTHQGIEYVRRYLKREDPHESLPRASCGVGYALLYIDALGNVFPGCFAMTPTGNIRERPLAEIIDSAAYRRLAQDMFQLNCPTCPNGYMWGALTNPEALLREIGDRATRKLRSVAR
jgi:MoaA/NifB/PqqE/SkfB family radical SAM enzyme